MLKSITAAAVLMLLSAPALAQKAPRVCKGLEQPTCATNTVCRWQAAREQGQPSKAGTPYVRSMKAHCRKVPAARSPKAKKAEQTT